MEESEGVLDMLFYWENLFVSFLSNGKYLWLWDISNGVFLWELFVRLVFLVKEVILFFYGWSGLRIVLVEDKENDLVILLVFNVVKVFLF